MLKRTSTFSSTTGWRRHFWLPALVAVHTSLWPQLGWACAMQTGQDAQPTRRATLCQCLGMTTGAMRSCQMPSARCCQPIRLPAQTPAAALTSASASKVLWLGEPKTRTHVSPARQSTLDVAPPLPTLSRRDFGVSALVWISFHGPPPNAGRAPPV